MEGKSVNKVFLFFTLLVLGMMGVLSLYSMNFPITESSREMLLKMFSEEEIKWLLLLNPAIMTFGAVAVGTVLFDRVGLKLPFFSSLLNGELNMRSLSLIAQSGVLFGTIAGVSMSLIYLVFSSHLLYDFHALSEEFKPTLEGRFLYGGITEEIIMRFGLMTFVVWIFKKIIRQKPNWIYIVGIILSSFFFAIGHLPIVFNLIEDPTTILISYIIAGNMIGGVIFGWLYWKKGLASAMIAHIFAHVVMLVKEWL